MDDDAVLQGTRINVAPNQMPKTDLRLATQRQVIDMMGALTTELAHSLAELDSRDPDKRINLGQPGKILLCFAGAVIVISICLRVIPAVFVKLEPYDFIALLVTGCLLAFMGAFLFIYQYHAEQAKTTAVVNTTERVTKGLVAVLGTEKD